MKIKLSKSQWELIGKKTGWMKLANNTNPDSPDFMVDINKKTKSLPASIKTKINNGIRNLGNYHAEIPLDAIFDICKSNNTIVLQEDGTEWSGFLTGKAECGTEKARNQHVLFRLAHKNDIGEYIYVSNALYMAWCVMGSGKYEIVCYVN